MVPVDPVTRGRILDRLDRVDLTSVGAHALARRHHLDSPTADQIADAETVVEATTPQTVAALIATVEHALSKVAYLRWLAHLPTEDAVFMSPAQLALRCVRDALGITD